MIRLNKVTAEKNPQRIRLRYYLFESESGIEEKVSNVQPKIVYKKSRAVKKRSLSANCQGKRVGQKEGYF
jgi:hypothetical protein